MPSEHRLHPFSILFSILKQFGALAVPMLLLIVGMGTDQDRWQGYAVVFIVPYALFSVMRYVTFRYRYDDNELVIRQGFIFRNQRHVPYDRIQNIDAIQNVLHRLLNVVEVRVQTGGGSEPEATLSVLAIGDLEEMRRRVFGSAGVTARGQGAVAVERADRETADDANAPAPAAPPARSSRTLLRLTPRDLVLYGIVENRGLIVIAAAFGLAWELASMSNVVERFLGEQASRSALRSAARMIFVDGGPSIAAAAWLVVGLAAFLIVSRVFSIGWAMVRLHGFHVQHSGDDLRTEYGLLTRIVQTIPRRRIQTVTVRQTPLHRWWRLASIRVSTAGGKEGEGGTGRREWFAPVIRADEVDGVLAVIAPGADLAAFDWQPLHPRAARRAFRRNLVVAGILQVLAVALLGRLAWLAAPVLVAWALQTARWFAAHTGWATTPDHVAFRTGTIVRAVTVAPLVRIQSASLNESPFDRRTGMARVYADTAGSDGGGYAINVPYLPREVASTLQQRLSAAAANTAFQW